MTMSNEFPRQPVPSIADPNSKLIFSNDTVTGSSSVVNTGFGAKEVSVVVNILNIPTGTGPGIQFTLQEVDPGDNTTSFGSSSSTSMITGSGVFTASLRSTFAGTIKTSWTVSGSTPSFTGVYTTLVSKSTTVLLGVDSSGNQQQIRADSLGTLITQGSSTGTATPVTGSVSARLTDGAAFYDAAKTGQLPSALVGGRLDVVVGAALPAGTNNIGDVDILSVPAPLSTTGTGTEAAALRVTIATDSTGILSVDDNGSSLTIDSTQLPAALVGGRFDENIGSWLGSTAPSVGQKTMAASVPVVISSDQTAILISGSISATNPSVGTNNSTAPTSTTQIGGSDGTNLQAGRTFDVDTSSDKQYVIGVTLRKSALSGSLEYGTSADPIRVDPTGMTTQPVTGSLTAQLQSGPKGSTAVASVTSTASGANHQPLDVAIYDAAGNQITTFGGGTQYGDGAARTATNVTGTIMMVDDGTNIQSVSGDASGRLNTVISSWFGSTVPTAGQKTMSGSIPFTLASDQGNVIIGISGTISSGNSSTSILTGSQVFTGLGVDTLAAASISIQVFANVASETDGLKFQWSQDNVNWDETLSFTLAASLGQAFMFGPHARFFRVQYTNGVVGQASFRLQTILKPVIVRHDTIRLADVPIGEQDATVVKAVISGKTTAGGGTYVDVKVNPSGAVQVGGSVAITDSGGTNTTAVKAASTAAIATDPALVVAISPNNSVSITAASLPLPSGAAQEHTGSASYNSSRLTDGSAFYDATKTGQLPTSLAGGKLDVNLGTWLGSTVPTAGQKTMSGSIPVVISSDQTAILISGSISATNPSVGTNASTAPVSSTQIGGSDGTNLQSGRVFDVDTSSDKQYVLGVTLRKSALSGSLEYGTSADPIRVDPTGTTTQPVTGSLTAQLQSGPKGSTAAASVTSTASGANHQPLDVAIYDAAGNQISTFGGGTQFGDGFARTATNVTGTIMMVDDGTNIQSVSGDSSGRLNTVMSSWFGSTVPTAGQKTMSGSIPFTLASDQSAILISGSITNPSIGTNASTAPTSTTQIGGSDGTNLQAGRIFDVDTSSDKQYVLGVTLRKSALSGSLEYGTSADPIRIDPTGTTTQPVTGSVGITNVVSVTTSGSLPVIINGVATITGSVAITAASLPLPAGAATSANQSTLGSQTTKINDGTNTASVMAASTTAVYADKALVVAISPNSNDIAVLGYNNGVGASATWDNTSNLLENIEAIPGTNPYDEPTVSISLTRTGTITAGEISFQGSDATGGVWFPVMATRVAAFTTESSYLLSGSADTMWKVSAAGFPNIRVQLTTQITGAGSVFVTTLWDASPIGDNRSTVGQSDETKLNATATLKSGLKGSSAAALVTSTASGADHQSLDVIIRNGTGQTPEVLDPYTAAPASAPSLVVAISPNSNIVTVGRYSNGAGEVATLTNATAINTTVVAVPANGLAAGSNAGTATFSMVRTGTISGGELSFQGSDDSGAWFPVRAVRTDTFTTATSQLLSGITDVMWKVSCAGFVSIRAKLTTVITGAGSLLVTTEWDASPVGDVTATVGQSDETLLKATATLKSGLKGSSAAALVTSTASGADHQILDVAIYDGSGNQISTFGGGTQYVVDAAAPTTPTGSISLAQRDDQLSTVTPVEGDWIQPRASSKGALWVTIPDINGDPITSFGGGTQYTVNAVAPADPVGTALVAERDDQLSTLSEVEGDWTQVRASAKGALWVTIPDTNGDPITSFGGGTQYADGAVRGTSTGTLLMVDDGVNIQSALGNTSGELYTIAKQGQAGTLSGSWPTRITDGTTVSAVKAASTAAVAADPALVVSLSPNSPGYMSQNVTVSSANSSTATLAGAASFVGTSVSTLGVATIQLIVFSDVASSAAGLAIQQSSDGTNWDFTDTFTVYALTGFNTTVAAIGSFARVVYTNGASAQGVFRLQTLLCPVAQLLNINETSAIQSITAQDTATSGTIYSNGQVIYGGTPTANSAVSASLQSWNSCVLQTSGTWSGTLALEASIDGGVTWTKKSLHLAGTDIQAMSFTSNFFGGLNTTGYSNVRIRSTAAWTGTATVRYIQSEDLNSVFIGNALRNADSSGNIQPAADIASRKFFTAVTDGTNTATVKAASVTALGADTALVTQLRSASSGTITNVSSSVTSVQLIAANTARIGAVIFNDSTSVCFVKFGIAAGPTNFTYRLTTNAVLEIPWSYTGRIDGIWTTANGNARITELV